MEIIFLSVVCFILTGVVGHMFMSLRDIKQKYKNITSGIDGTNMEEVILQYVEQVKDVNGKYSDLLQAIGNVYNKQKNCIQKVGMVRYNPFEETGGNLCYALALLNEKNDGVILNSIYSRDGSYNYGKPIVAGKTEYNLSKEEVEALKIALGQ